MNEQIEDLIYDLEELKLDPQVYVNETGETGGPTEIKTETYNDPGAGSSNTNKRRQQTYASESWQSINSNNKKAKQSDQFKPEFKEEKPISPNGIYLDLDCTIDARGTLLNRGKTMIYFFTYFGEGESSEIKFNMLHIAFKGNIQNWWSEIVLATKNIIGANVKTAFESSIEGVHQFVSYIASEFIGENWFELKEQNRIQEKRRASLAIEKLTMCKMCYINEYTCEFQRYYYQYFDIDERMQNISQLYYMKLPAPWNLYFEEEFEKHKKQIVGLPNSLGTRIKFLKERLEDLCYQRKLLNKSKKADIALCCDKTNMPTQWGCQRSYSKKKSKKKFFKKRIKKYKKFNKKKKKIQQ